MSETSFSNDIANISDSLDLGIINNNDQHYNELPQHNHPDSSINVSPNDCLTYSSLIQATNELVRCVVNDQILCRRVFTGIREWTNKLRNKEQFDVVFLSKNIDLTKQPSKQAYPIPASTRYAPSASANKRKTSSLEMSNTAKRVRNNYKKNATNEFTRIPRGRTLSKSCGLCSGKGHKRSRCQRVEQDYKRTPLPLHDSSLRNELVMSLVSLGLSGSQLHNRPMDDNRSILSDFPRKIKCLIIHKRYMKNSYYGSLCSAANICIEVTLIRENYEIRPEENRVLFDPAQVTKYILTLNNLVVSLL